MNRTTPFISQRLHVWPPCSLRKTSGISHPCTMAGNGRNGDNYGILLVTAQLAMARKMAYLERAARLLTPDAAQNQLMQLALFNNEAAGERYVASLTPPSS